jgi:hypothetical protein
MAGNLMTDQTFPPRIVQTPPLFKFLAYLGLAISSIAPVLALNALINARSVTKTIPSIVTKGFVWVIVTIGVFLSFGEFLASCGGHPVWMRGFTG